MDESHSAYKAQHDADVNRIMELRKAHKDEIRKSTLGPPIPFGLIPSQEEAVRREFRELQDKAEQVAREGGHSALAQLYERYIELGKGSRVAAAAYFTVARAHGYGEVTDRYLARYTFEREQLEELEQLEAEDRDPLRIGFRYYGPLKPTGDPGFARVAQAMRRGR